MGAPDTRSGLTLGVNGRPYDLDLDHRTTLLDALREHAGLTGTKKGCDHGQCGSCTVLLDGRRVNACLTLAVSVRGRAVTTVEGLGEPDALHPVQEQFLSCDAYQCGYCTSGQVVSAVAVLEEARAGWPSAVTEDLTARTTPLDDAEVRERMSGNLCRCGAYRGITAAVLGADRELSA
jgi:xanthine dehydrogenase YagT iron-sulfur-binding subunit